MCTRLIACARIIINHWLNDLFPAIKLNRGEIRCGERKIRANAERGIWTLWWWRWIRYGDEGRKRESITRLWARCIRRRRGGTAERRYLSDYLYKINSSPTFISRQVWQHNSYALFPAPLSPSDVESLLSTRILLSADPPPLKKPRRIGMELEELTIMAIESKYECLSDDIEVSVSFSIRECAWYDILLAKHRHRETVPRTI